MHSARPNHFTRSLAIPVLAVFAIASHSAAQSISPASHRATSASSTVSFKAMRADTGATGSLSGTVYDSVTNSPLAGAQVQLVNLDDKSKAYTVSADSLGRFHIDGMVPGRYAAGFFHPAIDALGIEAPLRSATVHAGADNFIALVIPGPMQIWSAVCGSHPTADSTGGVAGIVRDAATGFPIPNAKVVVTWREIVIDKRGLVSDERRAPAQTGDDGTYRLCGLPAADTVIGSAELGNRRSGLVEIPVPFHGVVRRDFSLGDSTTAVAFVPDPHASEAVQRQTTVLHGSAALSGTVHGPDGKPLQGAKIDVAGTGLTATSSSEGRFSIAGLPAGTFTAEARAIGFEPKRIAVDLSDKTPASVEFKFNERVQELSRVTIMGKPRRTPNDINDFLRRARTGMGHYIMASDEVLKNALTTTEALRMTPGVQVEPSSTGFGNVILMRGGCTPVVYVDGVQSYDGSSSLDDIVSPSQILGIETYAGLGEAPVQYQTNGCGVVLVWTKR
jgi:hypothetical protein